MSRPKRQYSRAFTPRSERRVAITIGRVPPTLAARVKAKAKRDGVSIRALVLTYLEQWSAPPDPQEAAK